MNAASVLPKISKSVLALICGAALFSAGISHADTMPADVHAKVEKYKKQLVEWAATPAVVAAVKESNSKGGIAGMTNAKWDELSETDAVVTGLNSSATGKQLTKWEDDKAIEKLNLRDEKANLVASSSASGKPLLYNNGSRPPFQNGMKGAWAAAEVKPDPTTQKKSVQISAPVLDGGKAIGVLHSAVLAE